MKQIPLLIICCKKDKSISIQQRNLKVLAREICKIRNSLGSETIKYF